jgi:hypothetical protein
MMLFHFVFALVFVVYFVAVVMVAVIFFGNLVFAFWNSPEIISMTVPSEASISKSGFVPSQGVGELALGPADHAKPDITLRIYAHLFRNDDSKAAAAIDAALARMVAKR